MTNFSGKPVCLLARTCADPVNTSSLPAQRVRGETEFDHVGVECLRTYIAIGVWDWLGVLGGAAAMVVPGDRHARFCHKLSSLLP